MHVFGAHFVYVYLQDITFQKMLRILYHCNLQTFVLESYSLMNVFLAWEQLLQVQLEVSQKCQLGWSFQVPWGECSCLCNPVFLFGQPVSITWQLVESRLTLYLCRCGCLLSIAWGPGVLSVTVLLCAVKVRALLWHSSVKGLLWDQGSVHSRHRALPVFSTTPKSFVAVKNLWAGCSFKKCLFQLE